MTAYKDEEYDDLFDALTTEPACVTYDEIGDRLGWATPKVSGVLASLRRPDVSREQGWTVPHVQRGTGERVYLPILLGDDRPLESEERESVRLGAVATLGHVATMGENESHALRETAQYLTPTQARRVRQVARALDGVAAMAEEAKTYVSNGKS